MSRKLVLNVAPVGFADKKVTAEFFDYQNEDQLRSLRNENRATHFVQRYHGTRIIAIPTIEQAPSLGGTADEFRLHGDLGLCAALLRNALVACLHKMGRSVLWFDPVEFVGQGDDDDLLGAALWEPLTRPAWLAVRPKYEISVRRVEFSKQPVFVGLALNVRSHRIIGAPCSELLAAGVRLTGLYVGRMETDRDPRIAARLKLVGRVRGVDGTRLLLDDTGGGGDAIEAAEAHLQVNGGFDACLAAVFGSDAARVEAALVQNLAAYRAGPARLERLQATLLFP